MEPNTDLRGALERARQALQGERAEPAAYGEALEALAGAADEAGSLGLQDLVCLLQDDLGEDPVEGDALSRHRTALERLGGYLDAPSADTARALLDAFRDQRWSAPLTDDDIDLFLEMLAPPAPAADPTPAKPAGTQEARQEEAGQEEAGQEEGATVEPQVVELLRAEAGRLGGEIGAALEQATASGQWAGLGERLAPAIEQFASAATATGMEGVAELCFYLRENLDALSDGEGAPPQRALALIGEWAGRLDRHLAALGDPGPARELAAYLADEGWPSPLPAHDGEAIVELLLQPRLAEGRRASDRPRHAGAEDVSLALPEEVNPDLLDALLQELPQQSAEFSAAIGRLVEGQGGLEDVQLAQRVAHSLKGAGNTVGVRGIANLTHHLEDILEILFERHLLPRGELATTLMDAADCLEAMSEAMLGVGSAPENAEAVLQQVLDWAHRIDAEGIENLDVTRAVPEAPPEARPQRNEPAVESPRPAPAGGDVVRVPARLMDELLRLGGEGIVNTGQLRSRVKGLRGRSRAMREQYRLIQQLTYELEQLVSVSGVIASTTTAAAAGADSVEMEQYNELHSCLSRLEEAVSDAKEVADTIHEELYGVEDLVIEQERLQKENQEAIYSSRMVPASTLVPRCERTVRQAARLTDKQVEFRVEGAETLMDSQVLGAFSEPLMHLLRNAVDHGIEPAEARRAAGKPERGSITLRFSRVGELIEVTCEDDGAGLDTERIRETALEKGLIEPDEVLSEDEINQLVLLPGFTTKGEATQVSGRGIGMDAVYARIKEIKGALSLHSVRGRGLKVVLHLPVSMLSVTATLVRCGELAAAISGYGVEAIEKIGHQALIEGDKGLEIDYRGERLAVTYLDLLMGRQARRRDEYALFIVQPEVGARRAVLADEVMAASQEVVVKGLGAYIPTIAGVVGVTILDDGAIAPVLDLPELLRSERHGHSLYLPEQEERASRRLALVVDDSLSARRAVATFLEESGFEVATAIDGLDALEQIGQRAPDILLVDMEMPRMNGIELTRELRQRDDTRELPVIMITSRSTARHKDEARDAGVDVYLIKPFNDIELQHHIDALLA